MKDSYSFDLDEAGLDKSYQQHRDAYIKIFDRLGVKYVIVSATSGAMGGSASEEFLAESEVGEDTFVRCLQSGYAANVEAVITAVTPGEPDSRYSSSSSAGRSSSTARIVSDTVDPSSPLRCSGADSRPEFGHPHADLGPRADAGVDH